MISWQSSQSLTIIFCRHGLILDTHADLEMPLPSWRTLCPEEMGSETTHSSTFDHFDVCLIVMNVLLALSEMLRLKDVHSLFYLHCSPDFLDNLLFYLNFSLFYFICRAKR